MMQKHARPSPAFPGPSLLPKRTPKTFPKLFAALAFMKIKRLHTLRDSWKGFEIEWCFCWSTKINHSGDGLPDTDGKEWERARAASS